MSVWTFSLLQAVFVLGFIAVQANPSDSTDDVQCPSGWHRIHRACYMLVTEEEQNWEGAQLYCHENSGELTVVESLREKEELEKYLVASSPDTNKFWVGLTRALETGDDWRWLGKDQLPLVANIMLWSNLLMKERPGQMCGMVDITSKRLQVGATRCKTEQAFICEYHNIGARNRQVPGSEATTLAVADIIETTTDEPVLTVSPTTDNCPCRGASSSSDVLSNDASDSPEDRVRRRNEALRVDEGLYQRYLQSQIDANNAKVMYYSKVTKLYQDALEKQSQYYSSHQIKVDLEITRLREGPKCT